MTLDLGKGGGSLVSLKDSNRKRNSIGVMQAMIQ